MRGTTKSEKNSTTGVCVVLMIMLCGNGGVGDNVMWLWWCYGCCDDCFDGVMVVVMMVLVVLWLL